MAVIISDPADMINLALARIGKKDRVASIWEGSEVAKQALDIYSQTRDAVMRANDYAFSERNVSLSLLKQAPATGYFPPNPWSGATNPPPPWLFEYTYPDDCLKVRSIKSAPLFVMEFDPQPNVFMIANDNYYTPPRKVILCNVPDAMLVYTGQVTNPATWEADFIEAFAAELGRRLAPVLANMEVAKFEAADAAQATATALRAEG